MAGWALDLRARVGCGRGLRLFLSEGLAGTEVALLHAVLEARAGSG